MSLDLMMEEIHSIAVANDFWDDTEPDINFMLAKLALIHSEISETLEAMRKMKGPHAVEEECADILIRLLDFVAGCKEHDWIDPGSFEEAVRAKIDINKSRPRKHGNLI